MSRCDGVRCGGGLVHRQHRTGRHAVADQPVGQFVAIMLDEGRGQDFAQSVAVDVALAVVGEAGVVSEFRPADQFA